MGEYEVRRLSSIGVTGIDDPILARLDSLDTSAQSRGHVPPKDPEDPFDVEVAKPIAIGIHRIYRLTAEKTPVEVRASLGGIPVLLAHSITPFYKPGRTPTGVWGMGYSSVLNDEECTTIALFPASRKYDVVDVSQQLSFGINASGGIELPTHADLPLLKEVSGLDIAHASLWMTTHQEFAIAIRCTMSVLEVQAGPVGAGGARWNLYRGRETIEVQQPLFQTILIPKGKKTLRFNIETWIRRSARFFGLVGSRHWNYPPQSFDVSLNGLTK